ncbi:MAG: DegV family protein [Candidatus Promineifilaceae bacterium]|nr:DegV family protein [Candidatus Promineifilaceae bacterium]
MGASRIAIVVDSTATIPEELVDHYDLHVVPQNLNWSGETLKDGIDITPDEFYERLGEAEELPTTSQPSTGEFYEIFSEIRQDYDSIIGIFISDKLSGTYSCAHAAAQMMEDYPIDVINSKSASMGLGFIALEAAKAIEAGKGHTEAVQAASELIPKVRVMFVVDTLEFLHRGGRIGGAQRLLGTVLSIKPVLHLEDGRIEPLASVRTKRKALGRVLELAEEEVAGKPGVHAAVLHAAVPEEATKFRDEVGERLRVDELILTDLSPVVGTHTGPGLVGLAYYVES